MRFSRKKQTAFLSFFLILEFFVVSALPASAGLFGGGGSMPSASSMLSEMEQRYHLNLGAIQNQGEGFNVSGDKNPAPEVSLFFSPSDPKEGQKLSAKAFPIYFSNTEESLYYTWYLKRAGCDLDDNVTDNDTLDLCNASDPNRGTSRREDPGDITVEDWKIEAMRILVQNGYDKEDANYATNTDDSDGYRAKFGGDNKVNPPNYCYAHDSVSGINYELAENINEPSFGDCGDGYTPMCLVGEGQANAGTVDFTSPSQQSVFNFTDTGKCYVSGYPTCSASTPTCSVGFARCVANSAAENDCGTAISSCTAGTDSGDANPVCEHLFPNAPGHKTAQRESNDSYSFNPDEEEFWGTNPQDPSTADNGNKDEANVAGLGQSTFAWNYVSGDQVGVAVEGSSMIPTKHNDSSYMIMWAFPKKDCPVTNTGSYTQSIRGYTVTIQAVDVEGEDTFDLNDCIKKNLVDPTQGGQATNLDVSVTATPDNPINDSTDDKSGDVVVVQTNVNNAQHNVTDIFFDWRVEIKDDMNFNDSNGRLDITEKLREWGLLGNTRGNALDSIRMKLDILDNNTYKFSDDSKLSDYLNDGVGYLRFKSSVTENFSGSAVRKGKSDVIVKFTSTDKKIIAYRAGVSSGRVTIAGGGAGEICPDPTQNPPAPAYEQALDRATCRVIKNDIIGLKVESSSGVSLSNFYWTVNGSPLICSTKVSTACSDTEQRNVNFFPVTGNLGDTYTVTVTGSDVNTGNTLTLTRTFVVVSPEVSIVSSNRDIAWPRLLGQYRDITGNTAVCPEGLCNDESTSMFEAFPGSTLGFRAVFIPGSLEGIAEKKWSLDGVATNVNTSGEIGFVADKLVGGIYNIGLTAQVKQPNETRRALLDIWGISPFDSPEINFSTAIQVQLQSQDLAVGPQNGPRKYLAAIVSYIPASVMFTFRIFLSGILILFVTGFLYTLLEDRRAKALESPSSGRE
ncbi:MAG: hypothetical protein Q7S04_04535 [Candidatus Moranbacteria bacterium]|nr:hypothetical protein [Candidatus Moranbacteria bacterium]